MSGQIRMTPASMRNRAKEYQNQAELVGEVISKMDSLLIDLQAEWDGDASSAYAEKYDILRPGFVKAQELITDISKALTETADVVEQTDANIASEFRKE